MALDLLLRLVLTALGRAVRPQTHSAVTGFVAA